MSAPLFTAADLVQVLGGRLLAGSRQAAVQRVCTDSRQVQAGDCFVALRGERTDGHRFVAAALEAGACCALVSEPVVWEAPRGTAVVQVADTREALGRMARWYLERIGAQVVGVTGSVGKTTTKDLAAAVLASRFQACRSEGNWNTDIGLPLTLFRLRPGDQVVVLEYAMRAAGEIARLTTLAQPQVAVLTRIAEAHIERLGSLAGIASAKAELLDALPCHGRAVLNADDSWQQRVASRSRAPILWYSAGAGGRAQAAEASRWADVYARDVRPLGREALAGAGQAGVMGLQFLLCTPQGEAPVELPLPGRHHLEDALAAAGVGCAFGLSPEEIARGLAGVRWSGGRGQVLRLGAWTVIDDTYNASPTATLAALRMLGDLAAGRRLAVLGDMLELGATAGEHHRRVGEAAASLALDGLFTFRPLARQIAESAVAAGLPAGRVHLFAEEEQALQAGRREGEMAALCRALRAELAPGDTVLVKASRAMRLDEVVAALRQAAQEPST